MTDPAPASLLVFTLGPEHECRRRQLLPPALSALELTLHRHCLDAAIAAGAAAGCRVLVSSPRLLTLPGRAVSLAQCGGPFGDRLRDSVRQAQKLEDGPVVVVGTDCPGLEARHVRLALDLLGEDPNALVLGPTDDGGVYLLATRRPLDGLLAEAVWCGRRTLRSLQRAAADRGWRLLTLQPLADLDGAADLDRWLSTSKGSPRWEALVATLIAVLSAYRYRFRRSRSSSRSALVATPRPGRAPPPTL